MSCRKWPCLADECAVKMDCVGTVVRAHAHVQVHQQALLLRRVQRASDALRAAQTINIRKNKRNKNLKNLNLKEDGEK